MTDEKLTERNEELQKLLNTFNRDQEIRRKQSTPRKSKSIKWLQEQLEQGPQPATEIKQAANAAGIKLRTLYKAKKSLGVISERIGSSNPPHWIWKLPTPDVSDNTGLYQIL